MSDFFRNLVDDMKDEDTTIMGDGKGAAEYGGTIDSGSYILCFGCAQAVSRRQCRGWCYLL